MPLGEVRTGKKAILGNKRKGGGRYASYISWKKDETKTVFFLTPIDEVMRVMMHSFVRKIVETDDGSERELWLNFMCRKDPAWTDESGGECPLCDDIGHKASEKILALAVEVEPVMNGKRFTGVDIKYRTGTDREGMEQEYPEVGIVMQSSGNFFQYLLTQSERREISDITWEITREGDGLTTKYNFFPIEFAPDIESIEKFVPDLYEYLNDLGSAERYEKELEGVKAEDQLSFGEGKSWKKRSTSKVDKEPAETPTESTTLFEQMKGAIEENSRKKNLESY